MDFEHVALSEVQWIPGLRNIVTFDDRPSPVPNQVIKFIQENLGVAPTEPDVPNQIFNPGDTVRITKGPFEGMLAIFEGPTTSAQRVQVLLNILGASRVQVKPSALEKVTAPPPKRVRRTRGRGRPIQSVAS
jgi:transcription antitermination factor NusG